jgi:hypothetical protein
LIFNAVITVAEEGGYVAFNLREATELDLEVFPMKSKTPAVLSCFEVPYAQAAGG